MADRVGSTAVDAAVDLSAADDPGSAFEAAHERGRMLLLRTSGTTDRPRGVLRTTASWASSFDHYSRFAEMDGSARVWVPGPRSSTMNLFALAHARALGASMVGPPRAATHACLTQTALSRLIDASSARAGLRDVVAGDQLPARLRDEAAVHGVRIRHYYGASELSFVACGDGVESLRSFPGVEIEIRAGTIWVRSPYLARGYSRDGGPLTIGSDGFATVGDAGHMSGDHLVVTGRSDVVVTGGATVLLHEVEGVLQDAAGPAVAVVGVPHDYLGAVIACVVDDPDRVSSAQRTASARLSPAQRPRLWYQVPRLPVTAAGKPDRRALRRMVVEARDGRGPARLLVPPGR